MASSTARATIIQAHIYRETQRILNINSLHFIAISLLFFPLTFSASVAIQSYSSSSPPSSHINVETYFDPPTLIFIKTIIAPSSTLLSIKTLIIVIAFTFFVILPTIAGIALITYSTNQAIHRKHLTFSSTLKSLSHSYIPLCSTILTGATKLILLSLLFTLGAFATTESIKSLGSNLDQFIFSLSIHLIASYAIAFTILFFLVNWGSAATIAVLELKSGFIPLRQSANQSTEFRSHSFSIEFLFGFVIGTGLKMNSVVVQIIGSTTNWVSVLLVFAICLYSSLMIMHYVITNTVLYVLYKEAHGEEIVKTSAKVDVSDKYVSVVVSDGEEEVP